MSKAFTGMRCAVLAAALMLGTVAGAQAEQVLRRGNGAEPETLDMHKSTGVTEANIEYDLFEGLVTFGPKGEEVPGVATNWDISDDGTVYTFHLRDNAKWSNGDPVTAEDFVYSLRRAVDPKTASDYAPVLAPLKNAEDIVAGKTPPDQLGAEAVDPHTLKLTLKASTPYFIGLMRHHISWPVHRATVEKFGDQWTRPGNMVSNGAFTLSEWTPQSQIVLKKNPNYWDAANVKLDTIYYYPTEDTAEELKRWEAGELDITYDVPSEQIKRAAQEYPGQFQNTPYLGTYYYVINLTRDPLKDAKLREALALTIDREILTDKITQGGELPAYSWVPPDILPGYHQQFVDFKDMSKEDRLAKAKQLYQEAGYSADKPLTIELLYNTSENHKKIAVAVANMWKQALGVQLNLNNQEWKVYLDTRDQKNFQIARAAWIGDYNDPVNFLDLFVSTAGERNDAGYNNPQYDELIEKASLEADPAARLKMLEQAEKIFLTDMPLIPIYHYTSQHMVSSKVKGWEFNILDFHLGKYLSVEA